MTIVSTCIQFQALWIHLELLKQHFDNLQNDAILAILLCSFERGILHQRSFLAPTLLFLCRCGNKCNKRWLVITDFVCFNFTSARLTPSTNDCFPFVQFKAMSPFNMVWIKRRMFDDFVRYLKLYTKYILYTFVSQ